MKHLSSSSIARLLSTSPDMKDLAILHIQHDTKIDHKLKGLHQIEAILQDSGFAEDAALIEKFHEHHEFFVSTDVKAAMSLKALCNETNAMFEVSVFQNGISLEELPKEKQKNGFLK